MRRHYFVERPKLQEFNCNLYRTVYKNPMPLSSSSPLSKRSLEFIARASRQKKSDWLDKNFSEYEEVLVNPLREISLRVAKALRNEAPGYRFPTRGFARIRRSGDKAKSHGMYKNWTGLYASKKPESRYEDFPSLYFHLSLEDQFSAGGLYMPSARQTKMIRAWIHHDNSLLENLLEDRDFKRYFKELGDERVLKTKPRDYPIDHPKIEMLKLMGWYVWRPFTKKELYSKNFADVLASHWRQVLRLNHVLDQYTATWPKEESDEKAIPAIKAPKLDW